MELPEHTWMVKPRLQIDRKCFRVTVSSFHIYKFEFSVGTGGWEVLRKVYGSVVTPDGSI